MEYFHFVGPQMAAKLVGMAGLVLAVFVFAGGFIGARLYYDAGGTPADVVALRYGVSAVVMLPFVVAARHRLARDPGWWRAVGLALVGGAPFGLLVLTGVAGAPVTHGAGMTPGVALIFGTLLAHFTLKETLGPRRIFGLVCAVLGLAVLVAPELKSGEAKWWGELAYIGAGVLWGSFTVALRAWKLRPLEGAALAATFSLPYLVIYVLLLEPRIPDVPIAHTIAQGVFHGIVFNVMAIMLYGWGIRRLGAVAGLAAMPLVPVFGTLMEWVVFDRTPHVLVIPAIGLITMGVAIVSMAAGPTGSVQKG